MSGKIHIVETYFAKLRKKVPSPASAVLIAGVRKLAYYSGLVAKNDHIYHVPEIAPSEELLDLHKDGRIGWEEYRKRYFRELLQRDGAEELAEILHHCIRMKRDLYFVCYEKDLSTCHRKLLFVLAWRVLKGLADEGRALQATKVEIQLRFQQWLEFMVAMDHLKSVPYIGRECAGVIYNLFKIQGGNQEKYVRAMQGKDVNLDDAFFGFGMLSDKHPFLRNFACLKEKKGKEGKKE